MFPRVKRSLFSVVVAVFLCGIATYRTDGFSPEIIEAPLGKREAPLPKGELQQVLNRPFRYLGKGRQCFVFEICRFLGVNNSRLKAKALSSA